jgi:hypothetical protein
LADFENAQLYERAKKVAAENEELKEYNRLALTEIEKLRQI